MDVEVWEWSGGCGGGVESGVGVSKRGGARMEVEVWWRLLCGACEEVSVGRRSGGAVSSVRRR